MVQNETNLVVADNSGATSVRVFRRLGGSFRRNATVGDVVICAVKSAIPNGKVKKSDVVNALPVTPDTGSPFTGDDTPPFLGTQKTESGQCHFHEGASGTAFRSLHPETLILML